MRKELFTQIKILCNELEIKYNPEFYFKMSDTQLKNEIERLSDMSDENYGNEYQIYRAMQNKFTKKGIQQ